MARASRIHEMGRRYIFENVAGLPAGPTVFLIVVDEQRISGNDEANTNKEGDDNLHVQTPLYCP
ncbi:hypothetical protein COMA2_60135 [Candidatus Nitrospira nitrificans]|uniref:Uncharacterized protein n=1 Tax=Candidatus Nitrospira nitrificans TaxID=1742973 RepID=A0A0S4LVL7_9BACT|nr:hypothetical protein COMA2_60135 [Candidatus Nitrospira nitrificans]